MAPTLSVQVAYQIQRSSKEIFEAIVDPDEMAKYFISKGSARMEEGKTVYWSFPEFPDEEPVQVGKIEQDRLVSFSWKIDGLDHFVEISLEPKGPADTLVKITERERPNDEEGIRWLMGNTEGWMNFLCCLKAYLEYGINLRKGGYDFYVKK